MEDTLFPEAPQTPAPIFAYRALKGFIFGSPTDDDDDEVQNKENTIPRNVPGEIKDIISTRHIPGHGETTTPQKRRRTNDVVPSPVKSILRPRGVATPRALHLQRGNVGVTFKDITKSMSPDGKVDRKAQDTTTKKSPRQHAEDQRTVRITMREKPFLAETAANDAPRTTKIPIPTPQIAPPSKKSKAEKHGAIDVPASTAPFDLEAYMRSTEREMKRLVQYAHKMRDYAKTQERKNTELRLALQECQKDNERLRKAEEDRDARPAAMGSGASEGQWAQVGARKEGQSQDFKFSSEGARAKPQKALAPGTSVKAGSSRDVQVQRSGPAEGSCDVGLQEPGQAKLDASRQNMLGEDGRGLEEGSREKERQSSARLAPERLAAARARLKQKAVKRKASEMSQVDWMNL